MKKSLKFAVAAITVILLLIGPLNFASASAEGTAIGTGLSNTFGDFNGGGFDFAKPDELIGISIAQLESLISGGGIGLSPETLQAISRFYILDNDGDGYCTVGGYSIKDFDGDGCCTIHDVLQMLYPSEGSCAIGDYVWLDMDRDGIQDANEIGLNGVKVELYKWTWEYELIATTVTSEHGGKPGWYCFENLPRGLYRVKIILPVNLEFTKPRQGTDRTLDSDADPKDGTTEWKLHAPFMNEKDMSIDAGAIPKTGGVSTTAYYMAGGSLLALGSFGIAFPRLALRKKQH